MNTKTLKAFAVVGEGYGDTPEQLEVAATDGVQLAVFATSPAAADRIELQGEEVREVVIVTAADFDRFTAERDTLHLRLNAADERADHLEAGIKWESDRNALLLASLTEAEDMLSVTSLEAGQRLAAAEQRNADQYGLLLAWYEKNAEGLIQVDDAAYHIVTATAEALDGKSTESGASE